MTHQKQRPNLSQMNERLGSSITNPWGIARLDGVSFHIYIYMLEFETGADHRYGMKRIDILSRFIICDIHSSRWQSMNVLFSTKDMSSKYTCGKGDGLQGTARFSH